MMIPTPLDVLHQVDYHRGRSVILAVRWVYPQRGASESGANLPYGHHTRPPCEHINLFQEREVQVWIVVVYACLTAS